MNIPTGAGSSVTGNQRVNTRSSSRLPPSMLSESGNNKRGLGPFHNAQTLTVTGHLVPSQMFFGHVEPGPRLTWVACGPHLPRDGCGPRTKKLWATSVVTSWVRVQRPVFEVPMSCSRPSVLPSPVQCPTLPHSSSSSSSSSFGIEMIFFSWFVCCAIYFKPICSFPVFIFDSVI